MRVIRFQVMAPKSPARSTCWFISSMCTMPLPMVLATAVPKKKAAIKFQKAAQATARKGVSTRVETTVAMELAASCQPFENSKARVRKTTTKRRAMLLTGGGPGKRKWRVARGEYRAPNKNIQNKGGSSDKGSPSVETRQEEAWARSGALEDDAFDDVGDVFAFVDSGLDDFEDFFPFDDLDGIFFLVEELGDERAAEAVALVFVSVNFDA